MNKIKRVKWPNGIELELPNTWYKLQLATIPTEIVEHIYVNEEKRIIVVKFVDGTVEKVKCDEEDDFDVTIGVALAICRRIFGSHARFYKKVVKDKTILVKDKIKKEKK